MTMLNVVILYGGSMYQRPGSHLVEMNVVSTSVCVCVCVCVSIKFAASSVID